MRVRIAVPEDARLLSELRIAQLHDEETQPDIEISEAMEDWFRKTYPNFEKVVSFDEKGQMIFTDREENQTKNALTVINADEKLEAIA